jgi:hypothetical protein
MPTRSATHRWFRVANPHGLLKRRDAVRLIQRHADAVRVFEDLRGYSALMVTDRNALRLVLFSDLTDAQIEAELQTAWQREHSQRDLFRDMRIEPANDDYHTAPARVFWNGRCELLRNIRSWLP